MIHPAAVWIVADQRKNQVDVVLSPDPRRTAETVRRIMCRFVPKGNKTVLGLSYLLMIPVAGIKGLTMPLITSSKTRKKELLKINK